MVETVDDGTSQAPDTGQLSLNSNWGLSGRNVGPGLPGFPLFKQVRILDYFKSWFLNIANHIYI